MASERARRMAYRPAELAELTGLTPAHIRLLVRQGVIPALPNCGHAVVIPAAAVESWLATGEWRATDLTAQAAR